MKILLTSENWRRINDTVLRIQPRLFQAESFDLKLSNIHTLNISTIEKIYVFGVGKNKFTYQYWSREELIDYINSDTFKNKIAKLMD